MKKHTIHEFDCGIYPQKVWVAIGVPDAVIKDMFGSEMPCFEDTCNAQVNIARRTKPDIKSGVLIRFRNKKEVNIGNVTHESIHAALAIFEYVGAEVRFDNQEPFAYLAGWIAEMCYSCIKQEQEGDRVFNYTI